MERVIDFCVPMAWHGGMETVLNMTGKYLVEQGYHVRVVQMIWRGLTWTDPKLEFHCLFDWETQIDWAKYRDGYRDFWREYGVPDCIFAVHWSAMTLILRDAMQENKMTCPLIGWPHNALSVYDRDGVGGAECFRLSDAVFAISDRICQEAEAACPSTSVVRIINPVAQEKIVYSEDRDTKELAFVGRISKEKRLPVIIRSLAMTEEPWTLTVIGDGGYEEEAALCEELGIESRVRFLGWQENPWEHLKQARACVVASEEEGFCLTMVEALLCGLTVLTTPVGVAEELIEDGKNGYFFGEGTERSLIRLLDELGKGELSFPSPEKCRDSAQGYAAEPALRDFLEKLEGVTGWNDIAPESA